MIPLPSYSQIAELIKKGATLEAQKQIMKLREAAIELQEENLTLREENKKLCEEKEVAANLEFEGHVYWLRKVRSGLGRFVRAATTSSTGFHGCMTAGSISPRRGGFVWFAIVPSIDVQRTTVTRKHLFPQGLESTRRRVGSCVYCRHRLSRHSRAQHD